MHGNYNNGIPRCRYTTEYAKRTQLDHPLTVYVREADILPQLDEWIAHHLSPGRLPGTIRALHTAQRSEQESPELADSERRLTGYRAALDSGSDPALVAQWINETQQEKNAVEQRFRVVAQRARPTNRISEAGLETMIRTLGA